MACELMEIARIGSMFMIGDQLEEIMQPQSWNYTDTDDIDFVDVNFNALKRVLLLTERIDPSLDVLTAVWVMRRDREDACEIAVAGKKLPKEGFNIYPLWPEIRRAFSGLPSSRVTSDLETAYYPIRNSLDRIVGVLEVSEAKQSYYV